MCVNGHVVAHVDFLVFVLMCVPVYVFVPLPVLVMCLHVLARVFVPACGFTCACVHVCM